MEKLSSLDSTFLTRFASRRHGRTRRYIAKTREVAIIGFGYDLIPYLRDWSPPGYILPLSPHLPPHPSTGEPEVPSALVTTGNADMGKTPFGKGSENHSASQATI